MMKQRTKAVTPKYIWNLLRVSRSYLSKQKVVLVLKLTNSRYSFLKYCIRKQVKKVVWLDTIKPIDTFKKSISVDGYEPDYGNQSHFIVEKPSINLYEFENATVHGESSHVILDDSIVMERLPLIPIEHCNYSTAFIKGHNSNYAMYGRNYEVIEIDKAFFLGGNGSWNYYHWSIEIVAKLKYFLSADISKTDIIIVLPDHAKNIESFSAVLKIILENNYRLVYISRNQVAKVKELYTITAPSNIVFNTSYGKNIGRDYFFFDKNSIDFIREKIINSAQYKEFLENVDKENSFKRVYLARKKDAGRSYNQNEVLDLLVKQGFIPVYLEDLSFFQQVHLFQNANFVVGASGAAWTNIIYLKPRAQGVSWLGSNISSFSCYSTLAKYYDCDLKFFSCEVNDESFNHSSYSVDLNTLSKKILECH